MPLRVVFVAVVVVVDVTVEEDRSLTKLGFRSIGGKALNESSVDNDSSFAPTTNENRFLVAFVSGDIAVQP